MASPWPPVRWAIPPTTNETFTNFFDRKTIGLDRGYITYNPLAHKWLSLTGGKFAYAWNRTQVTGDPDINPEGFNEKFSWDLSTPVVKNFTVHFMQLLFNEATAGTDSYALGGQVSGKLQFGRADHDADLYGHQVEQSGFDPASQRLRGAGDNHDRWAAGSGRRPGLRQGLRPSDRAALRLLRQRHDQRHL